MGIDIGVSAIVGATLRKLRRKAGKSQAELAEALDVSSGQIQKYETGKNQLNARRLWHACVFLECTPNDIFRKLIRKR